MLLHIKKFIWLSGILITTSCHYSLGIKKDLNTGLEASYNGFTADEVFLADSNDTPLQNNKIALGDKIKIIANGVANYKEKNGRVYPGCSILLTAANGDSVLYLPDAYQDLVEGQAADKAGLLSASLTTGEPMIVGNEYQLQVRFFDKQASSNHISASCQLKIIAAQ